MAVTFSRTVPWPARRPARRPNPGARRGSIRPLAALLACLLGLAALAACSTGDDAAVWGGSFTFVSPGGETEISYPPDQRGTVGSLSGPNLMTDQTISLSDFQGKVVVINFWGSWCGPCREEQPGLNVIATQLADEGVQFLGIDLEKGHPQSAGQDYHRNFQVPYPSIFDPTMRTILSLRGYPASAIPSTVVLDRQHRVAQIWLVSSQVPMGTVKSTVAAIAAETGTESRTATGAATSTRTGSAIGTEPGTATGAATSTRTGSASAIDGSR